MPRNSPTSSRTHPYRCGCSSCSVTMPGCEVPQPLNSHGRASTGNKGSSSRVASGNVCQSCPSPDGWLNVYASVRRAALHSSALFAVTTSLHARLRIAGARCANGAGYLGCASTISAAPLQKRSTRPAVIFALCSKFSDTPISAQRSTICNAEAQTLTISAMRSER